MRKMMREEFLRDVARHELKVKFDSETYRRLVFRNASNNWNQWFEIVTWPGSLVINGDMGTWSFSRVDDMFTFFRSSELKINASYWREKVTSESRFGGPSKTFDQETFKANVIDSLEGYGLSDSRRAEVIDALQQEVFCEEDEHEARRALSQFEFDNFRLSDTWEIDGSVYTFHFLWCLHAIVWGIQQYDASCESTTATKERKEA